MSFGKVCSYEEYRLQFALWCLCGVPLMMGADLRSLSPEYVSLMQNRDLLRIDQDEECRPPFVIRRGSVFTSNPEPKEGEFPWRELPDTSFTLFRHLSGGEFALAFINLSEAEACIRCEPVDLGLPVAGGIALKMRDAFTGGDLGKKSDIISQTVPGHDMKLYLCSLVPARG